MSTLLNTFEPFQGLNPLVYTEPSTVNTTFTLPTGANIQAGQRVYLFNTAANGGNYPVITVQGSAADGTVRSVYPQTDAEFVALQTNPTSQAHWGTRGLVNSSAINFTSSVSIAAGVGTPPAFTAATAAFWWRQGDRMKMELDLVFTGSGSGGRLALLVPNGKAIDTSKTGNVGSNTCYFGSGWGTISGVEHSIFLTYQSNGALSFFDFTLADYIQGTTAMASLFGQFDIPIVGWSATRG